MLGITVGDNEPVAKHISIAPGMNRHVIASRLFVAIDRLLDNAGIGVHPTSERWEPKG
jgi:hypothetical protein